MVDQLFKKKRVTREIDPQDRRIVRIRLTKRGQDAKIRLKKATQDLFSQILEDIPEGERENIVHSLETLKQSIVNTLESCCGEEVGE
jgi:DNA-binding MarR family transcriptional regulator